MSNLKPFWQFGMWSHNPSLQTLLLGLSFTPNPLSTAYCSTSSSRRQNFPSHRFFCHYWTPGCSNIWIKYLMSWYKLINKLGKFIDFQHAECSVATLAINDWISFFSKTNFILFQNINQTPNLFLLENLIFTYSVNPLNILYPVHAKFMTATTLQVW